ncbi:class I fructose-bisphosphate aldolase [Saccharomonospora sp. NPDC046836]|uniref:class I fructose-bisphosphate aldolase n=1 Tax=Saccharomonospora sp. NPDC046836 TaxID=3156921 RepID=UPI0033D39F11
MNTTDPATTAATMMAPGHGILAADESVATMSRRLVVAGVPATGENRRAYRELLVTTPGLADGISGVILCEETFGQSLSDGRPFPQALADMGVLPGIKVDTGTTPLAGSMVEKVTEGLDGLGGRLDRFAELGARFAKWRAVIVIGDGLPSRRARHANAHALARYARLCQAAGLVPIVEPEVLMDGPHPISHCAAATALTLADVFAELRAFGVRLDGIVLKPNMVLPGADSGDVAEPDEVARATVGTLQTVVPPDVAGVAFLSGGQRPATATANLAAIRRLPTPWPVTFSFGRALVAPALAAWAGRPDQVAAGQWALASRIGHNTAVLTDRGPLVRAGD